MQDTLIRLQADSIYVRHNLVSTDKPTLLMIHGLGDSGLAFADVFDDTRFREFNILVPDLVGYGRSSLSAAGDYRFDAQVKRLWEVIRRVGTRRVFIVGHSLGGDLATLLCASDRDRTIERFVNVEGDVTQFDLFISGKAVTADRQGRFREWFRDFADSTVYRDWGSRYESCRRYYASLRFCRADAFLANARECYERNTALEGTFRSEIGRLYTSLPAPRVFCFGSESLSPRTAQFLEERCLERRAFEAAFHWVMIDKREEFYSFLYGFLTAE